MNPHDCATSYVLLNHVNQDICHYITSFMTNPCYERRRDWETQIRHNFIHHIWHNKMEIHFNTISSLCNDNDVALHDSWPPATHTNPYLHKNILSRYLSRELYDFIDIIYTLAIEYPFIETLKRMQKMNRYRPRVQKRDFIDHFHLRGIFSLL